jgi:hypothetical protein
MKYIGGQPFPCWKIEKEDKEFCLPYANRMCQGAKCKNFKFGTEQSLDNYLDSKISEHCAKKFYEAAIAKGKLKSILHSPFRSDYTFFSPDDDFILQFNSGLTRQIEVRLKTRNVDPLPEYECCIDVIKPHLDYQFFSTNRKNGHIHNVGWADWEVIRQHAYPILKGEENCNFSHKVNEFNIRIEHLHSPLSFFDR